jgi:GTP-binding protein HflX
LFNALTGEDKRVSDQPFTTLTSKYQRRFVNNDITLLFIDTIGFVLDIDPRLIKSFQLNLLDILSSDLVLLLLEIDDPLLTMQIKLNESISLLREIGLPREKIILIFNKSDKTPELEKTIQEKLDLTILDLPWIVISAKNRKNLDVLLERIVVRLKELKLQPKDTSFSTIDEIPITE